MALSCPCTSVLIILVTIFLVIFVALHLKRILKFFKQFKPKKTSDNVLYIDKSQRPVTIIKSANQPGSRKKVNKMIKQQSQLSPSPVINHLQAPPIGTYLLQNTGSDNYQSPQIDTDDTITNLYQSSQINTDDTITNSRTFTPLASWIQGGGRGNS